MQSLKNKSFFFGTAIMNTLKMKLENVVVFHDGEQNESQIITKKIKPKFGGMTIPTMRTLTLKL